MKRRIFINLEKILSITCLTLLIFNLLTINVEGKVEEKIQISSVIDKDALVDSPDTVPMIIGFKDKIGKNESEMLINKGAKIKRVLKEINAISVRMPSQEINTIENNPKVKYVTENDKGIRIISETLPWGVDKIDAERVHPKYKGEGIVVAITDTGIDYNHEDLTGRVTNGWDYVNDDSDPMDDYGHGTHMAGIIAANDNDIGVIGVAPETSLLNMKMIDKDGGGSWDDAAASIIDSTNLGAKIISMSWTGCTDDPTLRAAIQYAYNQGVLLIAGAGNNEGGQICWPAAYPEVMAVTATDQNDNIVYFSSIGPEAEISAPGIDIISTVPTGSCTLCDPSGYASHGGTSMSTAFVSGTGALIWSAYPELNFNDVRSIITDYAIDYSSPGRDSSYGFGRVDAFASVNKIKMTVTSPNGGENLAVGSDHIIRWNYAGYPGPYVNIELIKGGVVNKTIASDVSIGSNGNGSYTWNIADIVPGNDYQIRITSTSDSSYVDTSDNNFTIDGVPVIDTPSIVVVSPNGGENWKHGKKYTIKWMSTGKIGKKVKIELLRRGFKVKTITSSTTNDGSYTWKISSTQLPGKYYKIRIKSKSNPSYFDTSDNNFTIS